MSELALYVFLCVSSIIYKCVIYCLKPNIGRLGIPHGPSGEKVAVVTVDDCDTAVAVRFGSLIGNYTCAAQGTQSGSKK